MKNSYKGFDENFSCRKFQYEVGKTYELDGDVVVCKRGFHACANPLDVFTYYPPGKSRYAIVEQSGTVDELLDKTASSSITIKKELSLAELIAAAATAQGDSPHSVTSGDCSHSATSGRSSHSVTSGYSAHAVTSGDYSHSATSGGCAHSVTSGVRAHSVTSGDCSYSATSGQNANATCNGAESCASTKGVGSVAAVLYSGNASAGEGGAIVLVERNAFGGIIAVFSSKVGENGIKPDVWYTLKNGKPVEVTE